MSLENADQVVKLAVGVTALVGALVAWFRWIRPLFRTAAQVGDTILGREEIKDRSGAVRQPAVPSIGVALDRTNQQVADLAIAVNRLADVHQRQDRMEARQDRQEERIEALEAGAIERVVTKAESASAFRAIEAVAKNHPED